jgi:methylated-DNA-protein-cysteine methyltransferase-like protein
MNCKAAIAAFFMHFRMTKNKDFFQAVYDIVRLIPPGRVTTYGAIAQALGSKGAARMVGWAMNASHGLLDVPAHRVVNRKGLLTGKMHFEDEGAMQRKLLADGITVVNDQIQQFESCFWDPKELG